MAGEISCDASTGITIYAQIRNRTSGYIWNGTTMETYASASGNLSTYAVTMTEQGTASAHYVGNAPSALAAGVYDVTARKKVNAWFAETDTLIANGELHWNTTVAVPLSDLATSGQIGTLSPLRIGRGTAISNFPVYLRSSADHVSPLTSGVVSGSIARDSSAFGPLQSGSFVEIGRGVYITNLTSGDTLANTFSLIFTGVGISGGTSDPCVISVITQRTSGQ